METARKFLTSATQRDPGYAKAMVMLALTHYFDLRFSYTKDAEGAQRELAALVRRALDIDPDEPYAVAMLGNVHTFAGRFDEELFLAVRIIEPRLHRQLRSGLQRDLEDDFLVPGTDGFGLIEVPNLQPGLRHRQRLALRQTAVRVRPCILIFVQLAR